MTHPREVFEHKVEERGDCWIWTGKIHQQGYGVFSLGRGNQVMAHRQAWEWWHERPIPDGLIVRHTCDVRACVSPHHLLLGTRAQNSADMVARGRSTRKDVCLRGHPMSGHNLIEKVVTSKTRTCRACRNLRQKAAA